MKSFFVLCIAVFLVYEASGASLPVVGDALPGVIDKAVGLVGGITDQIVKLPAELIKLGDAEKAADGKDAGGGDGGLNLGNILKGLPLIG